MRQNTPAAPLDNLTAVACQIVMVLVRHAEQMALIIMVNLAFRLHQQEAVNRSFLRLNRRAAAHHRPGSPGFLTQPRHDACLRQRAFCRFHGKAGGEHFRQDDQIPAVQIGQQRIEESQVSLAIHPRQRLLQYAKV